MVIGGGLLAVTLLVSAYLSASGTGVMKPELGVVPLAAGVVLVYAANAGWGRARTRPVVSPTWAPTIAAVALLIAPGVYWLAWRPPAEGTPTGVPVASLAIFDTVMVDLMAKWQIPGGTLAVVSNGRLVLARGYGLADVERDVIVQPGSLFRLASLSKPITAIAALKLVEEGLLDLDAKAFSLLDHLGPPSGADMDLDCVR